MHPRAAGPCHSTMTSPTRLPRIRLFPLLGLASVKHSRRRRFRSYRTIRTTPPHSACRCGCVLCVALHTDTPPGGASRHTTHTGHGTARPITRPTTRHFIGTRSPTRHRPRRRGKTGAPSVDTCDSQMTAHAACHAQPTCDNEVNIKNHNQDPSGAPGPPGAHHAPPTLHLRATRGCCSLCGVTSCGSKLTFVLVASSSLSPASTSDQLRPIYATKSASMLPSRDARRHGLSAEAAATRRSREEERKWSGQVCTLIRCPLCRYRLFHLLHLWRSRSAARGGRNEPG